MEFLNLIKEARTIRRFKQTPISQETLICLVDCARLSPCVANQQKLKYLIVKDQKAKDLVFPTIKWAGALKDWGGPKEGERPVAYIVILLDKNISTSRGVDYGIAAQSIILGAKSVGIGSCMIGSFNKPTLIKELALHEDMEPLLVIALGEPGESVVLEDVGEDGHTTYYRDEEDVHHVPKRSLKEVMPRFDGSVM